MKEKVVIASQEEISVFCNENGGITIKQSSWPEDDVFIFIQPMYVNILVSALRNEKKKLAEFLEDEE